MSLLDLYLSVQTPGVLLILEIEQVIQGHLVDGMAIVDEFVKPCLRNVFYYGSVPPSIPVI